MICGEFRFQSVGRIVASHCRSVFPLFLCLRIRNSLFAFHSLLSSFSLCPHFVLDSSQVMRAAVCVEDLTAVVTAEVKDRSGQLVAALLTRWHSTASSSSSSSSSSSDSSSTESSAESSSSSSANASGADSEPALTAELTGTSATAGVDSADAAVMRRLQLTTADAMSHAVFVGYALYVFYIFANTMVLG
jgi:hypothetical protein